MITFNHSGKLGHILYSLYFCKDLATLNRDTQFNFHIQTNVNEIDGSMGLNKKDFGFIKPLLESQEYINEVTCSNICPSNSFDLVSVRSLPLNLMSTDLRNYYYNLTPHHLTREFWKPIIKVEPNYQYKDKIIFACTPRYQNVFINYSILKKYKDKLIFIGLPKEWELFKKLYFDVKYLKCNNMLEMAQYIAGAKGMISNQNGLYAIAECLKTPRILVSCEWLKDQNDNYTEGPNNVHPFGGWNEVAPIETKIISSMQELIK